MKTKTTKKMKYISAKNPHEVAQALGIDSPVDQALMQYKSQLSIMASKAIETSGLTINEIVKRSGVARSKVSAIKNGALSGISIDLFLKVITASGNTVKLKMAS